MGASHDGTDGMILLSIGSLRFYGLDRVFAIASDLGFDGIETIVDDRWDTTDPLYLGRLSARYRLPVTAVHSPFSFVPTPAWGDDPVERMRGAVRLAEELGSEVAVFHLPFFAERRYARWLAEDLPRWQEQTPVRLAVENMPHARKILGRLGVLLGTGIFYERDRGRARNRLLGPFSRPCFVGNDFDGLSRFRHLVLDTTHLATGGGDPVEAYERIKSRLALIHVSNFNGREHQPLGRGEMDLRRFLSHVAGDGYRGHVTIELMPDYFPDRTEPTARAVLAADLALCRACLGGGGAPAADARPRAAETAGR
ncbi:MAG: sugar phosphate isomerase/epimerase [bacterium]|nr:sugar phosphate isomerase/epimerase [bacterium]